MSPQHSSRKSTDCFSFRAAILAGGIAIWLGGATSVHALTYVGDRANPGALRGELQSVYNSGERSIVIRPGTYTLPNIGHHVLDINGWQNAMISAYNVTLVHTDPNRFHNLLNLSNCTNVTFEGATLTQNSMSAYQGAHHRDRQGRFQSHHRRLAARRGLPGPSGAGTPLWNRRHRWMHLIEVTRGWLVKLEGQNRITRFAGQKPPRSKRPRGLNQQQHLFVGNYNCC
ncbi:MAG: hypothetical protein V4710_06860 [Verrucomicrobiota bacterium]